jgi:translation initiation factor 1
MAKSKSNINPTVYSTAYGRVCPACAKPVSGCICRQQKAAPAGDGVVRIGRETKGRKGKGVTIISGVPLDPSGVLDLAKELKKRCGSGGTVKDGNIEIQGDHRDMLFDELQQRGWPVKRCGG